MDIFCHKCTVSLQMSFHTCGSISVGYLPNSLMHLWFLITIDKLLSMDAVTLMFLAVMFENAAVPLQTLCLAFRYISVWCSQASVSILKSHLYFLFCDLCSYPLPAFLLDSLSFTYQFLNSLYILGKLTLCLRHDLQITFPFCVRFLVESWVCVVLQKFSSRSQIYQHFMASVFLVIVKSFPLWSLKGTLPSFLLELIWLQFSHLNLESFCSLSFILLQVAIQLSQYHLLSGSSFPHWFEMPPLS